MLLFHDLGADAVDWPCLLVQGRGSLDQQQHCCLKLQIRGSGKFEVCMWRRGGIEFGSRLGCQRGEEGWRGRRAWSEDVGPGFSREEVGLGTGVLVVAVERDVFVGQAGFGRERIPRISAGSSCSREGVVMLNHSSKGSKIKENNLNSRGYSGSKLIKSSYLLQF